MWFFGKRKERVAPDLPPRKIVELYHTCENGLLVVSHPRGKMHYPIERLCREFREGRGYEYIDALLRTATASGTDPDLVVQLREFLRAWCHVNQDES